MLKALLCLMISTQLMAYDTQALLPTGSYMNPVLNKYLHGNEDILRDIAIKEDQYQSFDDKGLFIDLRLLPVEQRRVLTSLGAVGLLLAFDQDVMDFVQSHKSDLTERLATAGDFMGSRDFLPYLFGGTMAVGLVFQNKKLQATAFSTLKSALIGQLIVETLKSLSHRQRPNKGEGPYSFGGASFGSDNTSFPSGHSAAAWSVATVFATEYSENRIVPWIAYSLATITSWSRVHDEKHWASDVVLGAAIGYVTGKMFSKSRRVGDTGGIKIIPQFGEYYGVKIKFEEKRRADDKKYINTKEDCWGTWSYDLCVAALEREEAQYKFLNGDYLKD